MQQSNWPTTPACMADYLRNLALLKSHDRAATGSQSEKIAAYEAALASHQGAMEAYLDAFRLWQAGDGAQPEPPASPPQAPTLGLDPISRSRFVSRRWRTSCATR